MPNRITLNVDVPVEFADGEWKAGMPIESPFVLRGERSTAFGLRIIPRYVGADLAPGSPAERIEVEYSGHLVVIGARTDEYFEFSGFYQEAIVEILVRQTTAFRYLEMIE